MWGVEGHTLIHRIATRDHQAFEHLYQRYAQRLIGYLTRLLSQRELAEEVLNEVMLALWQQAPQFDSRGPLIARLPRRLRRGYSSSNLFVPGANGCPSSINRSLSTAGPFD
jgi:hypothetical protein